jgi:alpha-glucosidase
MREPWVDGPEHEAIRKRYIEERYRLLPYIYTSMEETSRTGIPLMRAMFLEFPEDPAFTGVDREFMFGPDLLVAPGDETTNPYEVKLPAGPWYDFWSGLPVTGTQMVQPRLDTLPVYVRGGSIVPQQPVIQSTAENPVGALELSVYPGPHCQGDLYDDDGNTFSYQKGAVLRMQFTCESGEQGLKINIPEPKGNYKRWWNAVQVHAFGISHAPTAITVNGQSLTDWNFDSQHQRLTLSVREAGTASEIVIHE